jgi:hypothetical protein
MKERKGMFCRDLTCGIFLIYNEVNLTVGGLRSIENFFENKT